MRFMSFKRCIDLFNHELSVSAKKIVEENMSQVSNVLDLWVATAELFNKINTPILAKQCSATRRGSVYKHTDIH